eukprot:476854_1
MYEMEVSGSMLENYVLFKRYSDFHSLHAGLVKLVGSDDKLKTLQVKDELIIPELPKKTLNKNSKKVVEDRQHKLQFYLRTLLKSEALCKTNLIMDFLQVPKAWLHMVEPKKADIKKHNRKQARATRDRRLQEQEEEEMKLALAISASLAEAKKEKEKEQKEPMQYVGGGGQYRNSQLYAPPSVHVQQSPQQYQYTQPSAPPESPSLPQGWSAFRTADGKIFYQNDATQESTWDKPAPVVPQMAPLHNNQPQNANQYHNNGNVYHNNHAEQKQNDDPFGALSQQIDTNQQQQYDAVSQQYQAPQQYQTQQQYTQPQQAQTVAQYQQPQQAQQSQYQQPQQTQYAQAQQSQTYTQTQPQQAQYTQYNQQTVDATAYTQAQPQQSQYQPLQQSQYGQYNAQAEQQQTVDTTSTQYAQPQSQYTQYAAQYNPQTAPATYQAQQQQTYAQQPQNVQQSMWTSNAASSTTSNPSVNEYNTPTINNMDELVNFVNQRT